TSSEEYDMSEYGTLMDLASGEKIGPATAEQATWASEHGHPDSGGFAVDAEGTPRPADADPAVYGELRTVYIES
ncbi:MAG: hypothetical protein ACM30G_04440, partial [Micromonosporaceae bacterium]